MAQSPASLDPKPHARFPYVAALLCAACVGAAAWTWMRYSYCWRFKVSELFQRSESVERGEWPDQAYVVFQTDPSDFANSLNFISIHPDVREDERHTMYSQPHVLHGRVSKTASSGAGYLMPDGSVINNARPPGFLADASRFHPASIAGLVVGAMGVFVFSVALRHWLGERRRTRDEARV